MQIRGTTIKTGFECTCSREGTPRGPSVFKRENSFITCTCFVPDGIFVPFGIPTPVVFVDTKPIVDLSSDAVWNRLLREGKL